MLMNEDETQEAGESEESTAKPKKSKAKAKASKKKVAAKKKAAPVAKKKAKSASKPREVEEGMVSLAALSDQLGITPATARRKLRTAEYDKGEGRWKWKEGSAALKQVTKILSAE